MSKASPADSQSITRIRGNWTDRIWPRDSVIRTNDRILVERRTDARLRVDGAIGRGSIYLAPELGRCPGSDIGRHIAGRTPPSGLGSYELKKDTIGRGTNAQERFVLSVKNGAAVVQWRSGQLAVQALDEQIRDLGSAFTVVVDSAAKRGIIMVQEGVVSLRNGTVSATAGQSYTFGPGQQVQPVIVRTAGLEEIRFHSEEVWKTERTVASSLSALPKPRLPWKLIVGGAVGVTAASFAVKAIKGTPPAPPVPPVKAVVVIAIPL